MRQYYYLVASLPTLYFNDVPPFTAEIFLAHCTPWLSDRDTDVLHAASIQSREDCMGHPLLQNWNIALKDLHRVLAFARAQEMHWEIDAVPDSTGADVYASAAVQTAMNAENPLQSEEALMLYLWDFLDNLAVAHYFDLDYLIVYFLRLQIGLRLAKIRNNTQGGLRFQEMYTKMRETEQEKMA